MQGGSGRAGMRSQGVRVSAMAVARASVAWVAIVRAVDGALAAEQVGVARTAGGSGIGTPWTDSTGADHRARDAVRRAQEAARAGSSTDVFARPQPGRDASSGADAQDARGPQRGSAQPSTPTASSRGDAPAADAETMRRQGERERDARRLRTVPAPPLPPTQRIQPDAPPAPVSAPPPRIAIPGPGQPGGPPIALPTCGPMGCFDASGRALPSAGGDMLLTPEGRPCTRIGAALTC